MLQPAEKTYSATNLECLAIFCAEEHIRPCSYVRKFRIECDYYPLVFIDKMKNKNARVSRLRTSLSEYDYGESNRSLKLIL